MEDPVRIQHHYLFDPDVFEKYPELFHVYAQNAADNTERWFQKEKQTLYRLIKEITWPAITGPGFCGATNPGAGKSFNGIMTGVSNPVYNSDSLYVNTGANIFAVSDSPGVTPLSNNLFKKLDHRLKCESLENLEKIIYELGDGIGANRQATLALISLDNSLTQENFETAGVIIAGDTSVYYGNLIKKRFDRIWGMDHFWGTSHGQFKLRQVHLQEGDFFVIASDGIEALNRGSGTKSVQDIIWEQVKKGTENFAFNVMVTCNQVYKENFNGRGKTLLGGYDDITSLLVIPGELSHSSHHSYVLGGNIW